MGSSFPPSCFYGAVMGAVYAENGRRVEADRVYCADYHSDHASWKQQSYLARAE